MKADKVRELDSSELQNKLGDAGAQLFRLKFQLNMGQNDGIKKYRELKKDRARMLTILKERGVEPVAVVAPPAAKKGKK